MIPTTFDYIGCFIVTAAIITLWESYKERRNARSN